VVLENPEEVSQGDFGGEVEVAFDLIPEPSAALLLGGGLVGLGLRRRVA